MPLQVDRRQKEKIRFFYDERGLGPKEIWSELEKEFGKGYAASRATIVRELHKLRLEREQEYNWRSDEDTTVTSKKRRKVAKPIPWTTGEKGFNDEDTALISQVLTAATAYDMTTPGRTSIVLARWIVRLRKAYPLQPAIIIWQAAYRAEFDEYLEVKGKIKADYRHIDRALQFEPWKGDTEKSRYEEVCDSEKIGWDRHWWKSHVELFQRLATSLSTDK